MTEINMVDMCINLKETSDTKPKNKLKYCADKKNLMVIKKCPLKNVIKNKHILSSINENVINVNKIVIHTYQFLTMYLLHLHDENKDFPYIDIDLVKLIFKIVSKRIQKKGKPNKNPLLDKFKLFFNEHYKKDCIIDADIISDEKLSYILHYEAGDIVKNIETNIAEHLVEHVNKFVNNTFDVKNKIAEIKKFDISEKEKKELCTKFYSEIRAIKSDLLSSSKKLESDKKYHMWINKHKKYINTKKKLAKECVNYDVCVYPQDYIKAMIYINNQFNSFNVKHKDDPIKLFHVIPLRTNIIPKYITIDTSALINLYIKEDIAYYLKSVKNKGDEIWDANFETNKREFRRPGYSFHHMIKTDGISVSILLAKVGPNKKPINIRLTQNTKIKKADIPYIENTEITDDIKKKTIVVTDFGHSDLAYMMAETPALERTIIKDKEGKIIGDRTHNTKEFRYTRNQRNKEMGDKKYRNITEMIKKETIIMNRTVKEIETELSNYNSKTCDFNKFKEYCKVKNKMNRILFGYYAEIMYRKFKMNRYTNTQKSESKMINNMKKKYGDPKDCIIIAGDYDSKDNMKGRLPAISKKLIKLYKEAGYETYMINEHKTSKVCNHCETGENENFLMRPSPKPKTKGKPSLVWGLVRCNNEECKQIHNRDVNACRNMLKIIKSIIKGLGRPKIYTKKDAEKESQLIRTI
jgi:hypothetical protein